MGTEMRVCRIFAGGDTGLQCVKVNEDDLVICADRGYASAKKLGVAPHIIVGDFDSYEGELPEDSEILRSVPEKDDTDTLLAIKTALERGVGEIVIYGAMGGRFDHTVANIQSLSYIHGRGCTGTIVDDDNIITVCGKGVHRFPFMEGYYFSVFAMTDELYIKVMTGVKYPLADYVMTGSFPIGVSNEITDADAVLDITDGLALVVRSKMK